MKYYYLFLILMLISIPGCGILDDGDEGELRAIEGKIYFEAREQHEEHNVSNPVPYILLKSEKIYNCFNYSISASSQVSPGIVEINLNGIVYPDICLTALGPARGSVKLNIPEGTYTLSFRSAAFTDEYKLTIGRTSIRTEEISSSFTGFTNSLYHRYPLKSFVYLCGTTSEDTAICRMFIDTVASVIKIDRFEFPESGVIPYPHAAQGYQYNFPAQYFNYQSETDFDRIEGIMRSFRETYLKEKTGIGISVTNWRNKSYYSWGNNQMP